VVAAQSIREYDMVGTILEGTILILILGLILSHAADFSTAIRAVGAVYTQAVQTLAGVAG
jgi:hypothetical protein